MRQPEEHYHYNPEAKEWQLCRLDPCTPDAVYADLSGGADDCNPSGIVRPSGNRQAVSALLGLRLWLQGQGASLGDIDLPLDLVEWGLDALGYIDPEDMNN